MSLLAVPLILAGSYLVAYVVATLIVEGLDILGLCYSEKREARREERLEAEYAQRRPPLPAGAYRPSPYYVPQPGPILRRIVKHRLEMQ